MISAFLEKKGTDFYEEGPDGESPFSYAVYHGTLKYVAEERRDLEREKQIRADRDLPIFVEDDPTELSEPIPDYSK